MISYDLIKGMMIDINKINMNSSIPELYSASTHQVKHGIEGYFVEKKYVDHMKIKQERVYEGSKDKPTSRPTNISKKTTFIDDVQKISAKLPGPSTYEPK